eukprot:12883752-Prorocentrum_lima.AAC.1
MVQWPDACVVVAGLLERLPASGRGLLLEKWMAGVHGHECVPAIPPSRDGEWWVGDKWVNGWGACRRFPTAGMGS